MNKTSNLAQKELQKFKLPTGYSVDDIVVSKLYLEHILKLLKRTFQGETKLSQELSDLLIDVVGKMANIQGFEIIIYFTKSDLSKEKHIQQYDNKMESVEFLVDDVQTTIDDLLNFVMMEKSFLPSSQTKRNAYFHNESVVLAPGMILQKTK